LDRMADPTSMNCSFDVNGRSDPPFGMMSTSKEAQIAIFNDAVFLPLSCHYSPEHWECTKSGNAITITFPSPLIRCLGAARLAQNRSGTVMPNRVLVSVRVTAATSVAWS
jgi:hypothetical protein